MKQIYRIVPETIKLENGGAYQNNSQLLPGTIYDWEILAEPVLYERPNIGDLLHLLRFDDSGKRGGMYRVVGFAVIVAEDLVKHSFSSPVLVVMVVPVYYTQTERYDVIIRCFCQH